MTRQRWRWRGIVALTGVALALVIYPITPEANVINSDWPAFATGARLAMQDPGHLYNCDVQRAAQLEITGGAALVTPGICGILPLLAPAWVALVAVPFELLGTDLGGRLWILFGLACLAIGLWLASRPRRLGAVLPAFAAAPTAIMMLNAQLDGLVALGIGAAIALWSKPYLAGLALGLTLMKPQLVLPLGAALLLTRMWRVLAGWVAAGLVLWASFAVLNPRWVLDWLSGLGTPVRSFSREVDVPHFATMLPGGLQLYGVAALTAATVVVVLLMAWRCRADFPSAATILVAGGVLAAPHALPADLVLVAMALAIFGRAAWHDWLILSIGAIVAAVTPAPVPAVTGLLVIGWLLVRAAGLTWPRRAQPPASTR